MLTTRRECEDCGIRFTPKRRGQKQCDDCLDEKTRTDKETVLDAAGEPVNPEEYWQVFGLFGDWALADEPPKWSGQRPGEPGWYWWKEHTGAPAVPCQVTPGGAAFYKGTNTLIARGRGLWWPQKIEEPEWQASS